MVNSFSDVIGRFDGPAAFGRAVGMSPGAAKQAARRDSISGAWFTAIARAADERGYQEITLERLAELAAERRAA